MLFIVNYALSWTKAFRFVAKILLKRQVSWILTTFWEHGMNFDKRIDYHNNQQHIFSACASAMSTTHLFRYKSIETAIYFGKAT